MNEARLRSLVTPATTAAVTMELQQGIVGEGVLLPALRDECERAGTIANAARVCAAARTAGAQVVHFTLEPRADAAGFSTTSKIGALAMRQRATEGAFATEAGSVGAALVPGLGAQSTDVTMARVHGLTPFMGTSLDPVLRSMGVTTVVAMGVSVNVGVLGLVLSAVDLGYQVVLVRDAVAGVPADYASSVIDLSLSMLATVVTADELLAAWA
ncbi:MAG: isochorismatase family protein [Ilumatobacteraceae bacterium]